MIDLGGEPITGDEYYSDGLGRVTEFKYGRHISHAFMGSFPLKHLVDFGEGTYCNFQPWAQPEMLTYDTQTDIMYLF